MAINAYSHYIGSMVREYRTLLPDLKRHKSRYIGGLVFLVITDSSQLYLPQLIKRAIDLISLGEFTMSSMAAIAAQMTAVATLIAFGRFFWRSFINGASRQIEWELRNRMFQHLQKMSSTFYGRNKTGDLMAHMTNDVNAVRMATGIGFALAVDGLIMAVSVLVIMLNLNSRMVIVSLSPLPILTIGVLFFTRIVGEQFKRVQDGFSSLSDMVQESFSGVRVLKTFVQEGAFSKKFADQNLEYSRRNLALVRSWGFFYPAVRLLTGTTTLLFILLGGRGVMEGTMSPGEFTAFFSYLQMLTWPLLGAGFTINMIQRAAASLKRINKILDEKADIASVAPRPHHRKAITGAISFRNLIYTYPDTDGPVLNGIDIDIPAGHTIGILGKTGAGKSTLVSLIPRILDPPPGTVFIDNQDARLYHLDDLRSSISVVPQDSFLFSATIRENIAFGAADAPESHLRETTAISTIERDFKIFPDGWETVVGERGVTLSGGQKQRVSISRALSSDSSIVIFDDALSSVDTETEDNILSKLIPFLEGKTFLIVSHRISALKTADHIVVLGDGRIIQQGRHADLLSEKGFYAEIYRLQELEDSIRKGV